MPERYHVHVVPTPPRFHRVGKYGNVDWREDCSRCTNCVKLRCLYNVYTSEAAYNRDPDTPVVTLDECKACLSCVQGCTKGLLSVSINPGYLDMGDEYWKPDILLTTWNQADSGKIPVSGAGYRGKFYGYGFDSIWTDMSEIVRPTRDGIHGREYISTSVDVGPKPMRLRFAPDGSLLTPPSPLIELPLPVILDVPAWQVECEQLAVTRAMAAKRLGTVAAIPADECSALDESLLPSIMPLFGEEAGWSSFDHARQHLGAVRMVQLTDSPQAAGMAHIFQESRPNVVVSVRMALTPTSAERILELAKGGVRVFQLVADQHGRETLDDGRPGRHIKDALRAVHGRLVEAGIRDEVTLIVSGGIALAENMAKAIICGADAVALDTPPLVALGCRVCRDKSQCCRPNACPCEISGVEPEYAAQRIVNLMGAWHSQLIEVLGAMGIREARRLRGETGRAIFMEDIEKEAFGDLCRGSCGAGAIMTDWEQERVERSVQPAPDRYRNALGKYKIDRLASCTGCGRCAEVCAYGVHVKPKGYTFTLRPRDQFCVGPDCADCEDSCINQCPNHALVMRRNPTVDCMGDPRWTNDLILSNWHMASTGHMPPEHLESRRGETGGGFDRLVFSFEAEGYEDLPVPPAVDVDDIDLSLDLNQRGDGRPQVHIDIPVYGGGMSFGSVSIHTILAKARAAAAWNSFTCTGEGGYHDRLRPYDDHVITQVATGLFGVREETIQRVRIVEFKYAQGAKPGLGGHLLGDKNTPPVARMREAVAGNALFSPFPFHSVYSVEDHKKHVDWIKEMNPTCLVSVKVSTPTDVDMVAVGSFYAGAHIVHLDGSYGGTGAAPDIAKKNIAMPIEYAVPKVHKFLVAEGIRDQITLIASGGIRNPYDALKAIALGADGVVIGTAEMIALGCVRCACCESGRGCPRGIATTDPELMQQMSLEWSTQRLINMHSAWREQMLDVLQRLGMKSIRELRGRHDVLRYISDGEPGTRLDCAPAEAATVAAGAAL